MDTKQTRLVRTIASFLVALGLAATLRSAELPLRQFLPDYDSHILSSASVQKLHQDSDGYVWIGFYSTGLSRYNGHSTVTYGLDDGLVDLTIREILEDSRGHLWVGSDTGIVVSSKPLSEYKRGEKATFATTLGSVPILQTRVRRNTIHATGRGSVWVGTTADGIAAYVWTDNGLVERRIGTDIDGNGTDDPVHSIHSTNNGNLVIASVGQNNLLLISGGVDGFALQTISEAQGAPGAPISAWLSDPAGDIWAGGVDGTIWHTRAIDRRFEPIDSPLVGARVVEILDTPAGDIWAASLGTGIVRFSRHDVEISEHYTRADGLISDTLWSILIDHEGNLWFAQNGGLSRLMSDFEAFSFYRSALPDPACFVSIPPSEADERIWVGTGGGIAAIRPEGTVDVLTIDDGLLHNAVYALLRDEHSRIWVGTVGGFSIIDPVGHETVPGAIVNRELTLSGERNAISSYPFQVVYSIRETPLPVSADGDERERVIWIAGQSGLRMISDELSVSFRARSGLPGTGAVDVAVAADGHLWVGTTDRGIFRSRHPLTLDLIRTMTSANDADFGVEITSALFEPLWNVSTGAPTNGIRNLLRTGGHMWAGTANGLAVFDTQSSSPVAILDESTGLGGQTIVGTEHDPENDAVWVSQNAGIARVDTRSLEVTRIVTVGDGLLDNEAWAYHSLNQGPDGSIYLSTPKGLSVYRPWLDSPTLSRPLLRIDRADIVQGILGHRESVFEFAPLTYVNERDVVYRTRLLGYDEGWSPPTQEARIRYTNLPAFGLPRPYTLEVMAKSGDGVWTEPKRLEFDAIPPWWGRWWALILWTVTFVVIILLYNRFRTIALASQNARLESIVTERTSEIAAQAMEVETLDRIVQIINREVEFEKVLKALLEQGMVLFPEAERGGSLIYDHERGTMMIPAAIGYDKEVLSRIRLSASDARNRYETGGTEIDEGIYLLRSLGDLPGVTDIEGVVPPLSMLAMAITIDDRLEAFLVFENFERTNAFQQVNLRTARRYREHARTAVAKALILRELELRNRETQRANEAKSTFLANMSHELRTPLNSIIGFSELLVEKLGEEIDDRHRHFLRLILSSGQHLLAIINDILDLSKVEAGKMQLFPERFDPKLAIEGVQQVMRPVAAKKNVAIELIVPADLPQIESDAGKFKQVLYNLVSNAVKFSEPGTTVNIKADHIESSNQISVAVIDEGIGISPEHLETVFDEFRQVESSMSRRYEGTGLGLSLVRRFMQFLGGEIEVESELGKGSTFTFYLPVELPERLRPQESTREKTTTGDLAGTRGRVLVVEDDDETWEEIRKALEEADLTATRASTGEEACRLARTSLPDAMTLDISLPGEMSGWDVLKRLKADPATEELPVIIVSHSRDHELGLALGADEYLVKPVTPDQLNQRLRELVASRRGLSVHRLLLIDDDRIVHQILGGFLRDAGYEVISAMTGRDGVKQAIDSRPDAIILDLVLPDISGFQVAETLRQLGETSSIPVIVLTSKDLNTTEQSSLESHLEKIVRKGTGTRPALLDAIDRVLPRGSRESVS